MKGIILAGGIGARLGVLTKVVNKHLLPIYDNPMIYFPIRTLTRAGITSIMIVTDRRRAGDFMTLLGSGRQFGARFTYGLQDEASGIADAISISRDFADDGGLTVILGDNLFLGPMKINYNIGSNARVYLAKVNDPERFGIATLDRNRKIKDLIEKPKKPISNYAVTGLYQFPPDVFVKIDKLTRSQRGELEVTDLNKIYLAEGRLNYRIVKTPWIDAGTIDSLYKAQLMVRKYRSNKSHSE